MINRWMEHDFFKLYTGRRNSLGELITSLEIQYGYCNYNFILNE